MPVLPPDHAGTVVVRLTEWERVGPDQCPTLADGSLVDSDFRTAAASIGNFVTIRELRSGIEIESGAFVGRVDVGRLRVVIAPKLPTMPLTRLLSYAYGLRDLTIRGESAALADQFGLQEILVAILAVQAEELVRSGLARHYTSRSDWLTSPRGRIQITEFARHGGSGEAKLPCRYFERDLDWMLNQVVHAGLLHAMRLTEDRGLRVRLHRMCEAFGNGAARQRPSRANIERTARALTRMTSDYAGVLTLLGLLVADEGMTFDARGTPVPVPGFLFDMNRFFQRLLSRFLRDHIVGIRVNDEWPIRGMFAFDPSANPRDRPLPGPRPDLAITRARGLHSFADAKYRDLWAHPLPAEWLYQLAIYALASPARVSVMLYATTAEAASDERIEVRQPFDGIDPRGHTVIVRPVPLHRLADLLHPARRARRRADAERLAACLLSPETRAVGAA